MTPPALGPIARSVIRQRRDGLLDRAATSPRVYLLLLRAAVQADRRMALDQLRIPRQRTPNDAA